MLKKTGIIIFNVKNKPFNYNTKKDWQKKRNNFYKVDDASDLDNEFITSFYINYLKDRNFNVNYNMVVKRPQESGLYAYAFGVKYENN